MSVEEMIIRLWTTEPGGVAGTFTAANMSSVSVSVSVSESVCLCHLHISLCICLSLPLTLRKEREMNTDSCYKDKTHTHRWQWVNHTNKTIKPKKFTEPSGEWWLKMLTAWLPLLRQCFVFNGRVKIRYPSEQPAERERPKNTMGVCWQAVAMSLQLCHWCRTSGHSFMPPCWLETALQVCW